MNHITQGILLSFCGGKMENVKLKDKEGNIIIYRPRILETIKVTMKKYVKVKVKRRR